VFEKCRVTYVPRNLIALVLLTATTSMEQFPPSLESSQALCNCKWTDLSTNVSRCSLLDVRFFTDICYNRSLGTNSISGTIPTELGLATRLSIMYGSNAKKETPADERWSLKTVTSIPMAWEEQFQHNWRDCYNWIHCKPVGETKKTEKTRERERKEKTL
jgi:hypothetical protein